MILPRISVGGKFYFANNEIGKQSHIFIVSIYLFSLFYLFVPSFYRFDKMCVSLCVCVLICLLVRLRGCVCACVCDGG